MAEDEQTIAAILTMVNDLRAELQEANKKWNEEVMNHSSLRTELYKRYTEMKSEVRGYRKDVAEYRKTMDAMRDGFKTSLDLIDKWECDEPIDY
jgi:hypothetical protein